MSNFSLMMRSFRKRVRASEVGRGRFNTTGSFVLLSVPKNTSPNDPAACGSVLKSMESLFNCSITHFGVLVGRRVGVSRRMRPTGVAVVNAGVVINAPFSQLCSQYG